MATSCNWPDGHVSDALDALASRDLELSDYLGLYPELRRKSD